MQMITHMELEAMADRMLAPHLGRRTGIYTELQLRRRHRREVQESVCLESGYVTSRGEASRIEAELKEMLARDLLRLGRASRMTAEQFSVWELRLAGLTEDAIAEVCKVTHQAVSRRLRTARVRVIEALKADKYYGLREVYLEEVNRICKAHPCRRHSPVRIR